MTLRASRLGTVIWYRSQIAWALNKQMRAVSSVR